MLKDRRVLTGIVILGVLALLTSVASGVVNIPASVQSVYYSMIFQATGAAGNADTMEALHTATKVTRVGPDGKSFETYKYSKSDRGIIARDSGKCMACHGNMLEKDEKGKPKNYIHNKMLSAPMLNFSCTDCHKKIATNKRTPSQATLRVDRTLCPKCHDPSSKSPPAESTGGITWGNPQAPEMPNIFKKHGTDAKSGKWWIMNHPRFAMSIGVNECRKCHKIGSELDFCRDCHLRGGFRPSSHRVTYKAKIKEIYPEFATGSYKGQKTNPESVVKTNWKGYHFVFARNALKKMGVTVDSPRNLPMDKLQKLPCAACHVVKEWCTKCHIKHNPNWLNPTVGHPKKVSEFGTKYCTRCHDANGSKCEGCHTFFGTLN